MTNTKAVSESIPFKGSPIYKNRQSNTKADFCLAVAANLLVRLSQYRGQTNSYVRHTNVRD